MKTQVIYCFTILILKSCSQRQELINTRGSDLFNCGPDEFPNIFTRDTHHKETNNFQHLFIAFNDSIKTKHFPITYRHFTCINENEKKVGISFGESEPSSVDLLEFYVLINYDDNIGIHINADILRDTVINELNAKDIELAAFYDKIKQNSDADSLARPCILISLNLKIDERKQITKSDFEKFYKYIKEIVILTEKRAEELSMTLYRKPYNNLDMRQQIAVCNLLGYIVEINLL